MIPAVETEHAGLYPSWQYCVDDFDVVTRCHVGRNQRLKECFSDALRIVKGGIRSSGSLRWLDLGCGPGDLVIPLFEIAQQQRGGRGITTTLVDNDPAVCRRLREKLCPAFGQEGDRIEVACKDAVTFVRTVFREGVNYDLVTSFHLLYYLSDWPTFVRETRTLAGDGLLVLALKSGETPYYRAMRSVRESLGLSPIVPFFSEDLEPILAMERDWMYVVKRRDSRIVLPAGDQELWRLVSFTWRLPQEMPQYTQRKVCEKVRALAPKGWTEFVDVHILVAGEMFPKDSFIRDNG